MVHSSIQLPASSHGLNLVGNHPRHPARVVSLKSIEEQPQILLISTTPELKDVRGPVRSE